MTALRKTGYVARKTADARSCLNSRAPVRPRDCAQLRCTVVRLTVRHFWLQGTVVSTVQWTVRRQQLLVMILSIPGAPLNLHSCWNSNTRAPLSLKFSKLSHFWEHTFELRNTNCKRKMSWWKHIHPLLARIGEEIVEEKGQIRTENQSISRLINSPKTCYIKIINTSGRQQLEPATASTGRIHRELGFTHQVDCSTQFRQKRV